MFLAFSLFQITPAHDPNDYDVGMRHNLKFINIFTDDGKINSNGGKEFEGMLRFEARRAITEALKLKVFVESVRCSDFGNFMFLLHHFFTHASIDKFHFSHCLALCRSL